MSAAHNPGGRVLRRPVDVASGTAIFGGPADCYRYRLAWDMPKTPPRVLLAVMMNPSTATADAGDATVNKVWRMARARGFNRLLIGNVFAYRATNPVDLFKPVDPVGPENLDHVLEMADEADEIVLGYGRQRSAALRQQGPAVARELYLAGHKLHAFKETADGTPWHPLYLPDATIPRPWTLP